MSRKPHSFLGTLLVDRSSWKLENYCYIVIFLTGSRATSHFADSMVKFSLLHASEHASKEDLLILRMISF